jgi:hypothetical protein
VGLWDKIRQAPGSLRKLRQSQGPGGYGDYKRRRKSAREQANRFREHDEDSAERGREKAERERGYEDRYAHEREGDIARERTDRANE